MPMSLTEWEPCPYCHEWKRVNDYCCPGTEPDEPEEGTLLHDLLVEQETKDENYFEGLRGESDTGRLGEGVFA